MAESTSTSKSPISFACPNDRYFLGMCEWTGCPGAFGESPPTSAAKHPHLQPLADDEVDVYACAASNELLLGPKFTAIAELELRQWEMHCVLNSPLRKS